MRIQFGFILLAWGWVAAAHAGDAAPPTTRPAGAEERFDDLVQSPRLQFDPALWTRVAGEQQPQAGTKAPAAADRPVPVMDLDPDVRLRHVRVVRTPQGHQFVVRTPSGARTVSPDEFARGLYALRLDSSPDWLFTMLNISSPIGIAWVVLGLVGQVLFTGRMVVQWLVSEKAGRSMVPVSFWWMSLTGATMLLVYFLWRRDVVGMLGQGTGWLIYARNLWLICVPPKSGASPASCESL